VVTPIFPAASGDRIAVQASDETFADNERLLKSTGDLYPLGSELKEIADVISQVRSTIISVI